jgi:ribosomal protein S18 acetylase RimI-like enzyme
MAGLSKVQIHEFQINDYNVVFELWKEAGLVIRPGDDMNGVRMKLLRDPDLFLLARLGGEIVGCVIGGWDGRRGWVYHLAVKPSYQRRGIATALLSEVEKRLGEKGAKKINAQIYQSNTKSLKFFKARGYETHLDLVMVGKHLKN